MRFVIVTAVMISTVAFAGKPTRDTAVTTTIQGAGILPDAGISNLRIQNDQLGSYQNGVSSVVSILQAANGDWTLETGASSLRRVTVDLREPVPGSNPTPPFDYLQVGARGISKCSQNYPGSFAGLKGLNSTMMCQFSVAFSYAGNDWRIEMNPANNAETNWAKVTCTQVNGTISDPNSPCTAWRITPSVTDATGRAVNVARLVRLTTMKGRTVEENHGDYYMAFQIDISNP